MADAQIVRVNELLYRTRGRDWDYAFLLQPPPLLGEGWYTLHRRIFASVEPTCAPSLLRGTLGVGTGTPFFATTFTDPERRDSQDRAIAHYLIWLGKAAEQAPAVSYGPELLRLLRAPLDAVFELAPEALLRGQTKPLDTLLRQRFAAALSLSELELPTTERLTARWLGTIAP